MAATADTLASQGLVDKSKFNAVKAEGLFGNIPPDSDLRKYLDGAGVAVASSAQVSWAEFCDTAWQMRATQQRGSDLLSAIVDLVRPLQNDVSKAAYLVARAAIRVQVEKLASSLYGYSSVEALTYRVSVMAKVDNRLSSMKKAARRALKALSAYGACL